MKRRFALRQMGLQWYTPRCSLAQARPASLPLKAAPAVAARVSRPPLPDAPAGAGFPAAAIWQERAASSAPQPAEAVAAKPVRRRARQVSFSLLALAYPRSILLLSDLKSQPLPPALASSVASFVHELAQVFDDGTGPLRPPEYFQWPLAVGGAADASAERAALVLAGFVTRYLREYRPRWVLLLGSCASEYLAEPLRLPDGTEPVILRGPPLGRIFGEPGQKAALWRLVEPHSRFAPGHREASRR